ncbi:hypothetical protein E3T61_04415 [Cryobacterium lactosi]|uniref:Lipoprotein n=1 Tax=Cryobacterium lactosi TaxID=1259202 RepID=A0A4R9BYI2_9MICO|nr:hypothetical protein [Cryobacterium lactosi]TFD93347.1 hypothetical protein E3T61_04415 [Cryobacterium lactosi]
MTESTRRALATGLTVVAVLAVLTACSAGSPGADDSSPPTSSASAAPTPTTPPTPTATFDPDAAPDFAEEVFPLTGTGQYMVYNNGQLTVAEDSNTGVTTEADPGSYELRLACRGGADSSITITAVSAGTGPAVLTAPCDERTQTAPYSLEDTEVTLTATGSGDDPVVWAAVLAILPTP